MEKAAEACVDLSENGFMVTYATGGCSEVPYVCPPLASVMLKEHFGKLVTVESHDVGRSMRNSTGVPERADARSLSSRTAFYSRYRLLEDQNRQVDAAVAASGGACVLEEIGRTIEGRPMRVVRARGRNFRRGGPRVVLTFGVHAREWVVHMAGVYAVEEICAKARDDSEWLSSAEVVMIPMGNPDGHKYSTERDSYWRKNMNTNGGNRCGGVDLNRNFPVDWGGRYSSSNKCSQVYRGTAALSEPESQAIAKVTDEAPNLVLIDVHSYGRLILKPWSYTNNPHPRLEAVDELGWRMHRAIKKHRNNGFRYGGNELLGPADGVVADYTNGGFGSTMELTTGFHPSASEILPSAIENLDAIYAAIEWAKEQ
jgi:hypothetical protein